MCRGKLRKIFWLLLTFLLLGSLFAFAGTAYAFDPDTDLSDADASFWGEDLGYDVWLINGSAELLAVSESVAVSSPSVSLNVRETQQLTITATYSDGSTADVTATGTYVSSDPSVATVSTGGVITGAAQDSTTITVSYTEGGITKTTTVPVTVGLPEPSATRTLPMILGSVWPGTDLDISITASGCGAFGQVVETLPNGFSYLSCGSTEISVATTDNTIEFTFVGDSVTFTYTVKASYISGSYAFSGVVRDADMNEYPIGGDENVSVCVPWYYDADGDCVISKAEVIVAIRDYFDHFITKEFVLEHIKWYYLSLVE